MRVGPSSALAGASGGGASAAFIGRFGLRTFSLENFDNYTFTLRMFFTTKGVGGGPKGFFADLGCIVTHLELSDGSESVLTDFGNTPRVIRRDRLP